MSRIEAEHEPVEEPSPSARTFEKEAVHRRRQPHHAQPLAEGDLAARRFAVDAYDPPIAQAAIPPGADAQGAVSRRDGCGNRPAAGRSRTAVASRPAIDLAQLGATQPAPRGEERHRLQQVGLARAIGAGQDQRLGDEGKPGLAIVAEIGQHEPRHADATYRGTGIAAGFLCLGKHTNIWDRKRLFARTSTGCGSSEPSLCRGALRTAALRMSSGSDQTRIGIRT